MSEFSDARSSLVGHMAEVSRLGQVLGLLHWDQQVNLPPGAMADRGAQAQLLSGLIQERVADDRVGNWLSKLSDDDAGVRNIRRAYKRAVNVSPDLAGRMALARMEGYSAWHQARVEGDFGLFAPALRKNLDLAIEQARAIDSHRHPYDVLLEDYDPGTTLADLRVTFGRLREGLGQLISAVADREPVADLDDVIEEDLQRELHSRVVHAMGYAMENGRIDDAVHPFTVCMGAGDVRITTRVESHDLLGGLGATMHEAGHALYELGIPRGDLGSGIDSAASLGVHESQSRFWENFIGRSEPFFGFLVRQLDELVPGHGLTSDRLYRAANRIQPSLTRIYADEVTYNLHIIARFELEVAMLEGTLAVEDLPSAWNAKYRELLGVEPANDAEGVLQDVHWSSGTIGYFPSYSLGNLYAAALGKTMLSDIGNLWAHVGAGELGVVLDWLRERVHRHGHTWDGAELVRHVVGDVDLVEGLLDYLWGRHGALHEVSR